MRPTASAGVAGRGCDSVLETKASKFFGIFGWSEVGFSYFSVSLLTLLIFPQWICYLALLQCLLPAVYVLEHMVSEVPGQGVVYALRECSGLVVAAVFLLPWRRMVQEFFRQDRLLCSALVII